MKFSIEYNKLVSALSFPNTVLADKSVEDKMKNVIFMVNEGSVKVVGWNVFTFSRTDVTPISVEDVPESGEVFQVKASNLNKIIQSFSTLAKTHVEKLEFSYEGVKIMLSVYEVANSEEDARLSQVSRFLLENVPIMSNVQKDITKEFPEDVSLLPSGDLAFYIDSLTPIMSNDSSNTNASKLNFDSEYVYVRTSYMSGLLKNKLPEAFRDLTLSYSSVSFIKKLTESNDDIGVCKLDNYLCIQSGSTEAFLRYQKVKINYKTYLDKLSKEKGVRVDRLYLKDVLRRMSNLSPDGQMQITDDSLEVSNGNFSQSIPLNTVKQGTSGISFKVSIKFFESAILGRDEVFTGDVFIYFVQQIRGYMIFMMDKTGAWISNTQVTGV